MAMINIGGVDMPNPTSYSGDLSDLDSDNTGRASETGYMTRDRVRAGIYKLKLTWRVPRSQLKTIADAISPESFSVSFFDPTTAGNTTATMYAGSPSWNLLSYLDESTPGESWWELSVNLIEF
jgi:hypothetical protein